MKLLPMFVDQLPPGTATSGFDSAILFLSYGLFISAGLCPIKVGSVLGPAEIPVPCTCRLISPGLQCEEERDLKKPQ
jgi:hypothetical protein